MLDRELFYASKIAFPTTKHTIELENDNFLGPLGACLRKVKNDPERNCSRVAQCTRFLSFLSLRYKRSSTSSLANASRDNCSPQVIHKESQHKVLKAIDFLNRQPRTYSLVVNRIGSQRLHAKVPGRNPPSPH